MDSSSSISQSPTETTYAAPKRIKVIKTGNNGIEVTLETDRSPLEEQHWNKEEIPISPAPQNPLDAPTEDTQIDGYLEIELKNKNASFVISEEEWETIKPRKMPSGGRLLTGPWSQVLSGHLKESNPYCCFAFHYNRLKTENSRKRLAPFFKGIGICKIKECGVTVRLLIRGINEKTRLVDVSYTGKIRHKSNCDPWKGIVKYGERRNANGMMLLGLAHDKAEDKAESHDKNQFDD